MKKKDSFMVLFMIIASILMGLLSLYAAYTHKREE
ncbi:hypothetical protein RAHE111665_00055 [Rariglobus hedericola]